MLGLRSALLILLAAMALPLRAGEFSLGDHVTPLPEKSPYEFWETHLETGVLWRATGETHHDYLIVPQILSIRGPYQFKLGKAFGGEFLVRQHWSLLAEAFVKGPENHYFGFSGSPSIEWWSASKKVSTFFSAGGGFGWIDSQGINGGQGQDFTFNWFIKQGVRIRITERTSFTVAAFFQHLSNRGMTDPNPGLDAVGVLIGATVTF